MIYSCVRNDLSLPRRLYPDRAAAGTEKASPTGGFAARIRRSVFFGLADSCTAFPLRLRGRPEHRPSEGSRWAGRHLLGLRSKWLTSRLTASSWWLCLILACCDLPAGSLRTSSAAADPVEIWQKWIFSWLGWNACLFFLKKIKIKSDSEQF